MIKLDFPIEKSKCFTIGRGYSLFLGRHDIHTFGSHVKSNHFSNDWAWNKIFCGDFHSSWNDRTL